MNTRNAQETLSVTIMVLAAAAISAPCQADSPLDGLRAAHPRVLLQPGEIEQLRERLKTDETLDRWVGSLRADALEILATPPAKYEIPDGKRLLSVSRRVLERVRTLALLYLLDGDRKYLDRCWQELEAAGAFPDWNPSHFLDTAEMTHAFAIGLDWLYDDWTPGQRDNLCAAIVLHGLTPGRKSYRGQERYGWWVEAQHNWNQVCNAGMVMGALAVADDEPELAEEIVRGALASIPRAMKEFAPDGGYEEGPSYWGYGVSYNVYLIAAVESALGTEFGLSEYEGFARTVLFPMHLTGPTGYSFNFADARYAKPKTMDAVFWLGDRFRIPQAVRFAAARAQPRAMDVLWYRLPQGEANDLPTCAYWRGVEAVTLRSAWNDQQATYVAFKGGSPSVNHGHADLGSFVLEASGVRWALDLGSDNYNMPGYFDRDRGRWRYYRNRAESHNTLLINPDDAPDQVTQARATVVQFSSGAERSFGIVDLTDAYRPHVRHTRRGIALEGRDVLVQDELQAADKPVELWWSMCTSARIELSDDGRIAQLQHKGQRLQALLLSPAEARFSVRPAGPLPTSPDPAEQAENEHAQMLTIRLENQTDATLAVRFSPAPPPSIRHEKITRLAEW